MASLTGANGTRPSAANLTGPKASKKHLANGTPISPHLETHSLSARCGSEPPHSEPLFEIRSPPDIVSQRSKDEAYHILEHKGKKTMSAQNAITAGQVPSNTFDPRRLLDPKGFGNDQRQRDSKHASTESGSSQPPPSNRQLNSKSSESNGEPSEIQIDVFHKRAREDYEGQGMGSLIESLHNVSEREERPQKRSKVEKDQFGIEEDRKVKFVGGGKGGEIADYLKEKKKQGIAESGPANAVVDLTGGTYHLFKHSSLGH